MDSYSVFLKHNDVLTYLEKVEAETPKKAVIEAAPSNWIDEDDSPMDFVAVPEEHVINIEREEVQQEIR